MPNYSEEELIKGCIENNRKHQEALYRRFFEPMMRMCMRYTKDREVALEIINSGFLKVFVKLHTFQFKGSLEGWIRRIVFHTLSDHFKKKKNSVHFLEIEERDQPLDAEVYEKLYLEDIIQLTEKLPEASRRVFIKYAIEGYTHVEIAKELNISQGTSKWHLSNARDKLKKLIKRNYKRRYHAG